ncbi:MAG: SpoIIE family protein phosphatase [Candidatus Omnitrophica bacterium]|nr:SpoIIE family protein phosphatase [Candidatus Omnitrophota bacterium]
MAEDEVTKAKAGVPGADLKAATARLAAAKKNIQGVFVRRMDADYGVACEVLNEFRSINPGQAFSAVDVTGMDVSQVYNDVDGALDLAEVKKLLGEPKTESELNEIVTLAGVNEKGEVSVIRLTRRQAYEFYNRHMFGKYADAIRTNIDKLPDTNKFKAAAKAFFENLKYEDIMTKPQDESRSFAGDKIAVSCNMRSYAQYGNMNGDLNLAQQIGDYVYYANFDAMNHGAEAAILVALVKTLGVPLEGFFADAATPDKKAEFDEFLKTYFALQPGKGRFVTYFVSRFNLKTGELEVLNCATKAAYIYDKDGKNLQQLLSRNALAIGLSPFIPPGAMRPAKFTLNTGDKVVFFGDGFYEQRGGAQGEMFGENGAKKSLVENKEAKLPAEFVDSALDKLAEHRGVAIPSDDLSVAAFYVTTPQEAVQIDRLVQQAAQAVQPLTVPSVTIQSIVGSVSTFFSNMFNATIGRIVDGVLNSLIRPLLEALVARGILPEQIAGALETFLAQIQSLIAKFGNTAGIGLDILINGYVMPIVEEIIFRGLLPALGITPEKAAELFAIAHYGAAVRAGFIGSLAEFINSQIFKEHYDFALKMSALAASEAGLLGAIMAHIQYNLGAMPSGGLLHSILSGLFGAPAVKTEMPNLARAADMIEGALNNARKAGKVSPRFDEMVHDTAEKAAQADLERFIKKGDAAALGNFAEACKKLASECKDLAPAATEVLNNIAGEANKAVSKIEAAKPAKAAVPVAKLVRPAVKKPVVPKALEKAAAKPAVEVKEATKIRPTVPAKGKQSPYIEDWKSVRGLLIGYLAEKRDRRDKIEIRFDDMATELVRAVRVAENKVLLIFRSDAFAAAEYRGQVAESIGTILDTAFEETPLEGAAVSELIFDSEEERNLYNALQAKMKALNDKEAEEADKQFEEAFADFVRANNYVRPGFYETQHLGLVNVTYDDVHAVFTPLERALRMMNISDFMSELMRAYLAGEDFIYTVSHEGIEEVICRIPHKDIPSYFDITEGKQGKENLGKNEVRARASKELVHRLLAHYQSRASLREIQQFVSFLRELDLIDEHRRSDGALLAILAQCLSNEHLKGRLPLTNADNDKISKSGIPALINQILVLFREGKLTDEEGKFTEEAKPIIADIGAVLNAIRGKDGFDTDFGAEAYVADCIKQTVSNEINAFLEELDNKLTERRKGFLRRIADFVKRVGKEKVEAWTNERLQRAVKELRSGFASIGLSYKDVDKIITDIKKVAARKDLDAKARQAALNEKIQAVNEFFDRINPRLNEKYRLDHAGKSYGEVFVRQAIEQSALNYMDEVQARAGAELALSHGKWRKLEMPDGVQMEVENNFSLEELKEGVSLTVGGKEYRVRVDKDTLQFIVTDAVSGEEIEAAMSREDALEGRLRYELPDEGGSIIIEKDVNRVITTGKLVNGEKILIDGRNYQLVEDITKDETGKVVKRSSALHESYIQHLLWGDEIYGNGVTKIAEEYADSILNPAGAFDEAAAKAKLEDAFRKSKSFGFIKMLHEVVNPPETFGKDVSESEQRRRRKASKAIRSRLEAIRNYKDALKPEAEHEKKADQVRKLILGELRRELGRKQFTTQEAAALSNFFFHLISYDKGKLLEFRAGQKNLLPTLMRGNIGYLATAAGKLILAGFVLPHMRLLLGKQAGDHQAMNVLHENLPAVDRGMNDGTDYGLKHKVIAAIYGFESVNLSEICEGREWKKLEDLLERDDVVFRIDPGQQGHLGTHLRQIRKDSPALYELIIHKFNAYLIDEADRYYVATEQFIVSDPNGQMHNTEEQINRAKAVFEILRGIEKDQEDLGRPFIVSEEDYITMDFKTNPNPLCIVTGKETGIAVQGDATERLVEEVERRLQILNLTVNKKDRGDIRTYVMTYAMRRGRHYELERGDIRPMSDGGVTQTNFSSREQRIMLYWKGCYETDREIEARLAKIRSTSDSAEKARLESEIAELEANRPDYGMLKNSLTVDQAIGPEVLKLVDEVNRNTAAWVEERNIAANKEDCLKSKPIRVAVLKDFEAYTGMNVWSYIEGGRLYVRTATGEVREGRGIEKSEDGWAVINLDLLKNKENEGRRFRVFGDLSVRYEKGNFVFQREVMTASCTATRSDLAELYTGAQGEDHDSSFFDVSKVDTVFGFPTEEELGRYAGLTEATGTKGLHVISADKKDALRGGRRLIMNAIERLRRSVLVICNSDQRESLEEEFAKREGHHIYKVGTKVVELKGELRRAQDEMEMYDRKLSPEGTVQQQVLIKQRRHELDDLESRLRKLVEEKGEDSAEARTLKRQIEANRKHLDRLNELMKLSPDAAGVARDKAREEYKDIKKEMESVEKEEVQEILALKERTENETDALHGKHIMFVIDASTPGELVNAVAAVAAKLTLPSIVLSSNKRDTLQGANFQGVYNEVCFTHELSLNELIQGAGRVGRKEGDPADVYFVLEEEMFNKNATKIRECAAELDQVLGMQSAGRLEEMRRSFENKGMSHNEFARRVEIDPYREARQILGKFLRGDELTAREKLLLNGAFIGAQKNMDSITHRGREQFAYAKDKDSRTLRRIFSKIVKVYQMSREIGKRETNSAVTIEEMSALQDKNPDPEEVEDIFYNPNKGWYDGHEIMANSILRPLYEQLHLCKRHASNMKKARGFWGVKFRGPAGELQTYRVERRHRKWARMMEKFWYARAKLIEQYIREIEQGKLREDANKVTPVFFAQAAEAQALVGNRDIDYANLLNSDPYREAVNNQLALEDWFISDREDRSGRDDIAQKVVSEATSVHSALDATSDAKERAEFMESLGLEGEVVSDLMRSAREGKTDEIDSIAAGVTTEQAKKALDKLRARAVYRQEFDRKYVETGDKKIDKNIARQARRKARQAVRREVAGLTNKAVENTIKDIEESLALERYFNENGCINAVTGSLNSRGRKVLRRAHELEELKTKEDRAAILRGGRMGRAKEVAMGWPPDDEEIIENGFNMAQAVKLVLNLEARGIYDIYDNQGIDRLIKLFAAPSCLPGTDKAMYALTDDDIRMCLAAEDMNSAIIEKLIERNENNAAFRKRFLVFGGRMTEFKRLLESQRAKFARAKRAEERNFSNHLEKRKAVNFIERERVRWYPPQWLNRLADRWGFVRKIIDGLKAFSHKFLLGKAKAVSWIVERTEALRQEYIGREGITKIFRRLTTSDMRELKRIASKAAGNIKGIRKHSKEYNDIFSSVSAGLYSLIYEDHRFKPGQDKRTLEKGSLGGWRRTFGDTVRRLGAERVAEMTIAKFKDADGARQGREQTWGEYGKLDEGRKRAYDAALRQDIKRIMTRNVRAYAKYAVSLAACSVFAWFVGAIVPYTMSAILVIPFIYATVKFLSEANLLRKETVDKFSEAWQVMKAKSRFLRWLDSRPVRWVNENILRRIEGFVEGVFFLGATKGAVLRELSRLAEETGDPELKKVLYETMADIDKRTITVMPFAPQLWKARGVVRAAERRARLSKALRGVQKFKLDPATKDKGKEWAEKAIEQMKTGIKKHNEELARRARLVNKKSGALYDAGRKVNEELRKALKTRYLTEEKAADFASDEDILRVMREGRVTVLELLDGKKQGQKGVLALIDEIMKSDPSITREDAIRLIDPAILAAREAIAVRERETGRPATLREWQQALREYKVDNDGALEAIFGEEDVYTLIEQIERIDPTALDNLTMDDLLDFIRGERTNPVMETLGAHFPEKAEGKVPAGERTKMLASLLYAAFGKGINEDAIMQHPFVGTYDIAALVRSAEIEIARGNIEEAIRLYEEAFINMRNRGAENTIGAKEILGIVALKLSKLYYEAGLAAKDDKERERSFYWSSFLLGQARSLNHAIDRLGYSFWRSLYDVTTSLMGGGSSAKERAAKGKTMMDEIRARFLSSKEGFLEKYAANLEKCIEEEERFRVNYEAMQKGDAEAKQYMWDTLRRGANIFAGDKFDEKEFELWKKEFEFQHIDLDNPETKEKEMRDFFEGLGLPLMPFGVLRVSKELMVKICQGQKLNEESVAVTAQFAMPNGRTLKLIVVNKDKMVDIEKDHGLLPGILYAIKAQMVHELGHAVEYDRNGTKISRMERTVLPELFTFYIQTLFGKMKMSDIWSDPRRRESFREFYENELRIKYREEGMSPERIELQLKEDALSMEQALLAVVELEKKGLTEKQIVHVLRNVYNLEDLLTLTNSDLTDLREAISVSLGKEEKAKADIAVETARRADLEEAEKIRGEVIDNYHKNDKGLAIRKGEELEALCDDKVTVCKANYTEAVRTNDKDGTAKWADEALFWQHKLQDATILLAALYDAKGELANRDRCLIEAYILQTVEPPEGVKDPEKWIQVSRQLNEDTVKVFFAGRAVALRKATMENLKKAEKSFHMGAVLQRTARPEFERTAQEKIIEGGRLMSGVKRMFREAGIFDPNEEARFLEGLKPEEKARLQGLVDLIKRGAFTGSEDCNARRDYFIEELKKIAHVKDVELSENGNLLSCAAGNVDNEVTDVIIVHGDIIPIDPVYQREHGPELHYRVVAKPDGTKEYHLYAEGLLGADGTVGLSAVLDLLREIDPARSARLAIFVSFNEETVQDDVARTITRDHPLLRGRKIGMVVGFDAPADHNDKSLPKGAIRGGSFAKDKKAIGRMRQVKRILIKYYGDKTGFVTIGEVGKDAYDQATMLAENLGAVSFNIYDGVSREHSFTESLNFGDYLKSVEVFKEILGLDAPQAEGRALGEAEVELLDRLSRELPGIMAGIPLSQRGSLASALNITSASQEMLAKKIEQVKSGSVEDYINFIKLFAEVLNEEGRVIKGVLRDMIKKRFPGLSEELRGLMAEALFVKPELVRALDRIVVKVGSPDQMEEWVGDRNALGAFDRTTGVVYFNEDIAKSKRALDVTAHELTHAIPNEAIDGLYRSQDPIERTLAVMMDEARAVETSREMARVRGDEEHVKSYDKLAERIQTGIVDLEDMIKNPAAPFDQTALIEECSKLRNIFDVLGLIMHDTITWDIHLPTGVVVPKAFVVKGFHAPVMHMNIVQGIDLGSIRNAVSALREKGVDFDNMNGVFPNDVEREVILPLDKAIQSLLEKGVIDLYPDEVSYLVWLSTIIGRKQLNQMNSYTGANVAVGNEVRINAETVESYLKGFEEKAEQAKRAAIRV